ncbi:MAG TPA: methyltransferase domain-containing protein [Gemmataceae bacterium]|nr:methyltransferase domain-containing protein [Gemmataceae bacterium]
MNATRTLSQPWINDCELMQCPDCGSSLEVVSTCTQEGLVCLACQRGFPIRDGMLDMLKPLDGNNKIAADFYNGPLWPRFRFWEWFTFLCNGGERRARRQIMKYLPNLSGTRLLEVAIGDGANVSLIPADCELYGNDISTVQLSNCRRQHPGRDLRLFLSEAENLPFRDHSFDNVLSVGAFNYFSDPLKSLREMARVVKPGGLVVVSDEVPNLPNRMIGHWIGLPKLDRWIMSRFLNLGPEFTDMVDKHRHLQLEPIVREALTDWQIHSLWFTVGYCIVGRPKVQ